MTFELQDWIPLSRRVRERRRDEDRETHFFCEKLRHELWFVFKAQNSQSKLHLLHHVLPGCDAGGLSSRVHGFARILLYADDQSASAV